MNQTCRKFDLQVTMLLLVSLPLIWRRQLSGAALEALKEFYADRDAREKQFEDLKSASISEETKNKSLTMEAFAENWNESQFWVCHLSLSHDTDPC